jgi:hypothetical protein
VFTDQSGGNIFSCQRSCHPPKFPHSPGRATSTVLPHFRCMRYFLCNFLILSLWIIIAPFLNCTFLFGFRFDYCSWPNPSCCSLVSCVTIIVLASVPL